MPEIVSLSIDDREVSAPVGTTIWEAAKSVGIDIPVLCHDPKLRPVAVCRICAVEIEGWRAPAAACIREVEPGMVVRTTSARLERARRTLLELLLADHPAPCERELRTADCELEALGRSYGITETRFERRAWKDGQDASSPVITVDHTACILCDRCIRACNDIQSNEVIGRTDKGYASAISFDLKLPMGRSTCVSCGECVTYCPTGALRHKPQSADAAITPKAVSEETQVDSVCPYCGVGCAIQYHVQNGRIVQVTGRESPVNEGRLCVKGRYGFDYAHHPQRLTKPLIRRKQFYPKRALSAEVRGDGGRGESRRPGGLVDYEEVIPTFREATWDEALDLAASELLAIKKKHGASTIAGLGSAKCSNEDNYLFQKLLRAVFGTNNVDHCARLCHATSVAALMETLGSGAVSNVFTDVQHSDVAVVIGSNTVENHPVAATFIKAAAKRGTRLIVMDPRRSGLADHAYRYVRLNPGTDVALLSGIIHVIIRESLINRGFIAERTEGFGGVRKAVEAYTPKRVEGITGVPRELIEEVARLYGNAKNAIIFWGMGVSQHTTGTDNVRCLVSLAMMTGNLGRPGTGLHPLRGQNNVQGASDMGLIPTAYTDYQAVSDPEARAKFEGAWGAKLDPNPGLTVTEITTGALEDRIKGMFIMGENPFLSDPNVNKVRTALASLDFLAVQDIFLTETAEFADVILPAASFAEKEGTYTSTDRRVQLGRKAVDPPGEARPDWEVIADIANRLGYPMRYESAEEVFREITGLSPRLGGLAYDRLGKRGMLWPCPTSDHPGTSVLFTDSFPRGKGKFVPVEFAPAKELPDEEYPLVLNTGRILEHWHTGTMTRRSRALHAIRSEPYVEMHQEDMSKLGIEDHDWVRVSSRRGAIELKACCDNRVASGSVFIPFHFREAAANVLTIDEIDPWGKTPEYKFCAVKIERLEE